MNNSRIRPAVYTVILAAATLLLTGCLEVVQHIGSGPGDSVDNYVRVTLQRGIFSFAEAFGGEAMTDEDFAEEFGMSEQEVLEDLPAGVSARFEPVITEFDFGFSLRTTTDRSFRSDEGAFVPMIRDGSLYIHLPPGDEEEADEAAFFLASAKYRIILDKEVMPHVSSAEIVGTGGTTQVDVTEFQNVWLLEFPVLLWFSGGNKPVIQVRS